MPASGRRKTKPPPGEIFLSHSNTDLRFLKKLHRALADHGLRAWYSKHKILGAQQWHDEIGQALERCDWFGLVLSPSACRSKWVKRELLYALQEDRYEGRIVPILHKPCDPRKLSWTLGSLQRVDDFTKSFEQGCKQLLRIWGIRYIANR
jgi:hypothetical protein